jgi:hypothetical protein
LHCGERSKLTHHAHRCSRRSPVSGTASIRTPESGAGTGHPAPINWRLGPRSGALVRYQLSHRDQVAVVERPGIPTVATEAFQCRELVDATPRNTEFRGGFAEAIGCGHRQYSKVRWALQDRSRIGLLLRTQLCGVFAQLAFHAGACRGLVRIRDGRWHGFGRRLAGMRFQPLFVTLLLTKQLPEQSHGTTFFQRPARRSTVRLGEGISWKSSY